MFFISAEDYEVDNSEKPKKTRRREKILSAIPTRLTSVLLLAFLRVTCCGRESELRIQNSLSFFTLTEGEGHLLPFYLCWRFYVRFDSKSPIQRAWVWWTTTTTVRCENYECLLSNSEQTILLSSPMKGLQLLLAWSEIVVITAVDVYISVCTTLEIRRDNKNAMRVRCSSPSD